MTPITRSLCRAALAALLPATPCAFALDAVVDVNSDGLLVTDPGLGVPVDRPTAEQPFLFWVNHDQDDKEDSGETWPIERPDAETPQIDSLRDLEDFARLAVRLGDAPADDAVLEFRWRGPDAPEINLFAAADPECTRVHLLDRDAALVQLGSP